MAEYFVTCGAVIGDISGSTLEGDYTKQKPAELITPYSHFTDDTVLTCAVAVALQKALEIVNIDEVECQNSAQKIILDELASSIKEFGLAYPHAGYGGNFKKWLKGIINGPYGSYGNGAAMRCSYAGWAAESLATAELLGRLTAQVTHNHQDAMTAASVIAGCIFLLRHDAGKAEILNYVSRHYDLSFTLDALRPIHAFNITARGTTAVSIAIFLESETFTDAIALADSMGGDTDTIAAITGSIAEAAYAIPQDLFDSAAAKLDKRLSNAFSRIQSNWLAAGNLVASKPARLAPMRAQTHWL